MACIAGNYWSNPLSESPTGCALIQVAWVDSDGSISPDYVEGAEYVEKWFCDDELGGTYTYSAIVGPDDIPYQGLVSRYASMSVESGQSVLVNDEIVQLAPASQRDRGNLINQPSMTNNPVVLNSESGHQYFKFDNSHYAAAATATAEYPEMTAYLVARFNSGLSEIALSRELTTESGIIFFHSNTGKFVSGNPGAPESLKTANGSTSADGWNVFTIRRGSFVGSDNDIAQLFQNGVLADGEINYNFSSSTISWPYLTIGGGLSNSFDYRSDIAEIILYDTMHTTEQVEEYTSNLMTRWSGLF